MDWVFAITIFGKSFVFKGSAERYKDDEESPETSGSNDLAADDRADIDHSDQGVNEDPELITEDENALHLRNKEDLDDYDDIDRKDKKRGFKVGFSK